MIPHYQLSEKEAIARDALSSECKTPDERLQMFDDLMEATEAILASIPAEERLRRLLIAVKLDPRPNPWWRNVRPEALAEFECQASSS
jgi:hypothetical protein